MKFWSGELFFDVGKKTLFPIMGGMTNVSGLCWSLCCGPTSKNWKRASKEVDGNYKGEGLKAGGVFVMGPEQQGIIFQHVEKVIGDNLVSAGRTREVITALAKII
mmetsp:Transcript_1168/g.2637  ORF Transcript_1168/g.2637 Transcript_1168/m.2637 type:complete len:105 (-) Transcript_1168:207-521(-)